MPATTAANTEPGDQEPDHSNSGGHLALHHGGLRARGKVDWSICRILA